MQLIICAFDGEKKAEEARDAIHRLDKQLDAIALGNLAIVKKTADGKIGMAESRDRRLRLSRVAAPVVGAVTWFVSQIAGAPAPVMEGTAEFETDAALGRWMRDGGFPDAALRTVGERLHNGESAILLLVKPEEEPIVVKELEGLGGHILTHELSDETLARLMDNAPPLE